MKCIVIDLDDTLVDTFGSVLVPLEFGIAERLVAREEAEGMGGAVRLALARLEARMAQPADICGFLRGRGIRWAATDAEEALRLERLACGRPDALDRFELELDWFETLRKLRGRMKLHLLTKGERVFQDRKIERLGLRELFDTVRVVGACEKERAIAECAAQLGIAENEVCVVGNRVDDEIAAGLKLGCRTIHVRHGEGSRLEARRPAHGQYLEVWGREALRHVLHRGL